MSGYYSIYLDLFESQEAWLYCLIFAAYTTLPNKLLHSKLSKSAKHLNSTVTHCTMDEWQPPLDSEPHTLVQDALCAFYVQLSSAV
jgi:hypothetical protein